MLSSPEHAQSAPDITINKTADAVLLPRRASFTKASDPK
jgi:hypothetical protein